MLKIDVDKNSKGTLEFAGSNVEILRNLASMAVVIIAKLGDRDLDKAELFKDIFSKILEHEWEEGSKWLT
jgi:hypothetical protein